MVYSSKPAKSSWILTTAVLLLLTIAVPAAFSASPGDVVINEIAWMGTNAYTGDEWIELYNTTSSAISLSGWTLNATDGTPSINLSGTIPANGYYILERTDDYCIANIKADLIFTGALSNTGESLELRDNTSTLIDTANSNGGAWPAGTNTPKATMERISPFLSDTDSNWQTATGTANNARDDSGDLIIGTPKAASSPPGPGRALDFDGVDDHVLVSDAASLDLASTGTIEAWIHADSFTANAGIIHKGDASDSSDAAYELKLGASGSETKIVFAVYDASGTVYSITGTTDLVSYKRYHIAGVWDSSASTMTLYINGVQEATGTVAAARNSAGSLRIGARFTGGADPFDGKIDEVRIWNIARTQTQIRDAMCQRLAGNESGLVAYYRFDLESGTRCPDYTGTGNDGTMTNMDPATDRVLSDAAIGDDSAYDYTGSTATDFSATLSHPDGDSITATGDGGTWRDSTNPKSGLQVYRIDGSPNSERDLVQWIRADRRIRYWGVFVTGGTDPTYSLNYTYTGFPGIENEENLRLAYREASDRSWKDAQATLDTTNDKLTVSGLSGTEFILGSLVDPRNAIQYGGPTTTEYVAVTEVSNFNLGTNGTLEAWIYMNSFNDSSRIIFRGDSTIPGTCYELRFGTGANNNRVEFVIIDSSGTSSVEQTSTALTTGTWYHVAGVWDNDGLNGDDRMELYLNGILEDNTGTTRTARNGDTLYFGAQFTGSNCIDGIIDEIRIWNDDRTQSNIQDTMCHKLTGTEPGLIGYWRFDKESSTDTSCPDYTGNGNTGTMTNFSNIGTARVCSKAPIGDASNHDYTGTAPANFSVTLSHPDGDSVTATGDGGSWNSTLNSVLQVYRVDEAPVYPPDIASSPYPQSPNGLTPPSGWSSIDYYRYWGVFVAGGTNPTYQFVYNYAGNPSVPADDSVLGLATRTDFCDRTWADSGATLNTTADTLTTTGQTATEYALGGNQAPLAIELASFTATQEGECITLRWETTSENGTQGFYIWRSTQKTEGYEKVSAFIESKAIDPNVGAIYTYNDCTVDIDISRTYYYRLEEEDDQPSEPNTFYSLMGQEGVLFDPDDINEPESSSGCFIGSMGQ